MLSNVGHTIQKMINNTPVAITVNEKTTAVVTNGGNVYQAGFIGSRIQYSFNEVLANENIVGRVVDAEATDDGVYLLNAAGSVFQYDNNSGDCGPLVREVYSPTACGGDKAIKIDAGRAHVVILTEGNKVFGAGNNEEYQLVPQGQCKYDTAVELVITDTNLHDNNCCNAFTGILNELECPIIPTESDDHCNKISCIKDTLCDVLIGHLNIKDVTLCPPGSCGILSVPIFGDISYVGFLCVDKKNCVSGSLTYKITRLYIKCGCGLAKFTYNDSCGCHICDINVSSTHEVLLFEADPCQPSKAELCCPQSVAPITGTAQIQGKCGSCVTVDLEDNIGIALPCVAFDSECNTIILELRCDRTTLTVLCDGAFADLSEDNIVCLDLDIDVPLKCCEPYRPPKPEIVLPQPCWANVYAGHNITVLVDSCNRIYALGSLHEVRSNKDLLKRSCLEELLSKSNASISFPADQLNCSNRAVKNSNCKCPKCRDKPFKTDLNKFGIHLSFPNGCEDECEEKNTTVCDFLHALKRCNDSEACEPTCEPCDSYIYLNIAGNCGCSCGAQPAPHIGSITLFNKKSICKLVSQGCPDLLSVPVNLSSQVEFDLNKYCIDNLDVKLERIIKLDFCVKGPNVNLYIDVDQPGGIKFFADGKKCNIEFTVNASTQTRQFILNFGSILDPVELTNLKYALSLDCYYPCPRFKNPFDTKIINTYLKGGDKVRFVITNPNTIRQAVTADVPTVFRLNRRVLDVAIGQNNLSVLVGGLACPNEVFAIGQNCHGELGLGTNESIVCWRQVNRCLFDCQVVAIFAGKFVTFYVTQSHRVYATGQWKCFVNSTSPEVVKSICQAWRIKEIAIAKNHIVLLGSDGCIFGLGDNTLGELGLCHLDCVAKPSPLVFFYKLNNCVAKQLCDSLNHPIEKKHKKYNNCNPCDDGDFDGGRPDNYVKYTKYPRGKKYSPNGRCCVPKYGKY